MRTKQPLFYRQTGVREKAQLVRPRLIPLRRLELPFESIYHYVPEDTVSMGPSPQDPLLTEINARLFIEHITELQTREGNPRRTVLNPMMLMNDYRRKTRGIRPLRKDNALLINPRNVLVFNYAMLGALYRYIPSFKANYFRWLNVNNTFWTKVKEAHERFGWNQFIDLQLPEQIPTFEQFKRFEGGLTQKSLEVFSTTPALNLMDLWFWLGDDRQRSGLSVLPDEALGKIHFIVKVKGYFFVINLGVINTWRLDKEEEKDVGITGSVLQRRFLRLLHGLRDLMSGVTQLEEETPVQDTPATTSVDPTAPPQPVNRKEQPLPAASPPAATPGELDLALPLPGGFTLPDPITPPESPVMVAPKLINERRAETDTPVEEVRYRVPAEETGSLATETEAPSLDDQLSQVVVGKAWELHENGLMSAKAYARTLEDARTYKRLKDPYGSGQPLESMLTVSQEELTLPDEIDFPDRATITDKSMLSSKLKGMQQKYVSKVLKKDIVSSVMAIQQQGITVKDYNIETVRDAMNHYEIHTVVLKPVRGRQSTVRFRLPVVDRDGRFVSNGVTYKLRLQRADQPLRKVNPSRVALTSYYNKTFVDRSGRKVHDYEGWLCNTITERGINADDPSVTDLKFANVFDMTRDLPRVYSMLAKRFSQFKSGGIQFFFDYSKREEYFQTQHNLTVHGYEQANQIVVGVLRGEPVLVDSNNTFYRISPDATEVLGPVTDVLGIDTAGAPLEVVEMTVANKTLPVGFVLAYQLGLSELINQLGCDVNRFRRGERNSTQPDEYTLVFQDEVLVFSRMDQRSSMILAGLNRFHQTLKVHSVWDFDRKDVYYRLLEEIGMGVRYLREIESLFNSWVDPITRGLLEAMGEPVEFKGLLFRSVELLQTDYSPEEVDGAFMRYRGYERFAGMVYGELSRAARTFNSRISTGEAAVEMNPHAVWQKVVQDPAVSPVEESNPIQDLREQEVMTYRGDGGRSGKSMVERTRVYHNSDVGVVSESTVDSGDVGVVAYLSPDANFTNLRGMTRTFDGEKDGVSTLLSTSALLAPGAAHDDPKRIRH